MGGRNSRLSFVNLKKKMHRSYDGSLMARHPTITIKNAVPIEEEIKNIERSKQNKYKNIEEMLVFTLHMYSKITKLDAKCKSIEKKPNLSVNPSPNFMRKATVIRLKDK